MAVRFNAALFQIRGCRFINICVLLLSDGCRDLRNRRRSISDSIKQLWITDSERTTHIHWDHFTNATALTALNYLLMLIQMHLLVVECWNLFNYIFSVIISANLLLLFLFSLVDKIIRLVADCCAVVCSCCQATDNKIWSNHNHAVGRLVFTCW